MVSIIKGVLPVFAQQYLEVPNGTFKATVEANRSYQSFSINQSKTIDASVADNHQEIGTTTSHYKLITTIGSKYEVKAISSGALVGLTVDVADPTNIESNGANPENTEQLLKFTAENRVSNLEFSYNATEGTTFQIQYLAVAATAQGNDTTPLLINSGSVFKNKPGQVDNTSSYYEIQVTPGYAYRIRIKDALEAGSEPISNLSYTTNLSTNYTDCDLTITNPECVVVADGTSIFLKVDGPTTAGSYSKFTITAGYNPVRDPDNFQDSFPLTTLPNNLIGQVPYGTPPTVEELQNNNFGDSSSFYWVTGLKAATFYKVRLSDIQDGTRLWLNGYFNSLYTCKFGAAGNETISDVYCIVKTHDLFNPSFQGISIQIDNSFTSIGTKGTTYTLNMNEVPESELYYFSTFRNQTATADCPLGCESLGYRMYTNNSSIPFAVSITSSDQFYKKLLHLQPGEQIFIQINDNQSRGDAYSINIGDRYKTSSGATVENPDQYEANNDNIQSNATVLTYGISSNHSLSNNDGNFGDIDWFTFTAP